MTPMQITVVWGEALAGKARKVRGGMNAIAEAARMVAGPTVGGRSTFAKLYEMSGPPDEDAWRFRAWLVLAALDETPEEWGISDADVPNGFSPKRLREQVVRALRWTTASAGQDSEAA